ncbi:MAG: tetratricopeptide repeat protein [Betaproteobacteria bacterium]|nr:tetratricopeptide repeat protein [Betaproteobacteria bacterium]
MSLLLEALKKAEKAKQEQAGKTGSLPEAGPGAPRPMIPEVGQTDPGEAGAPGRTGKRAADFPLDELPPPSALKPRIPEGQAAGEERTGAEAMFAAKRLDGNRKNIVIGLLAVLFLGLGGGGAYLWWEISRPTAPQLSARAPTAPTPTPIAGPPASAPAPAPAAGAPAMPGPLRVEPAAPAEVPAAKVEVARPAEPARPSTLARRAVPGPETASPIRISRTAVDSTVNPALAAAYEAFTAGDLPRAEQRYLRHLDSEPRNRDALLGLAAIALKRGHANEAERYYLRVLELDPRDAQANAGLMAVRTQGDPRQVESRLKMLISQQPESAVLHFALGNVYAAESRWAEAQQAYFRAASAEPANADYAFNLAVSLDHLNQNKLAVDYYRRGLALASRGIASFDRQLASSRLRELEQ